MITIITPTYNRPGLLFSRCVPSVLAQTYTDWEMLIVGDGCAPETVAAIEAGIADHRISFVNLPRQAYPENDPEAAWRQTAVNASNWGMDHARGEWITGLADDDELPPDALSVLLAATDGVDAVYGRAEVVGCGFIGAYPPREGQIQSFMCRAGLPQRLKVSNYPSDWALVAQMLADGVTFGFVPDVVYRYFPNLHVPRVDA